MVWGGEKLSPSTLDTHYMLACHMNDLVLHSLWSGWPLASVHCIRDQTVCINETLYDVSKKEEIS